MHAMEARPPAGWYPDPSQPQTQRYWDGAQWTEHRAPLTPAQEDRGADALVVVGYITAVILPIIGFILGIVLMVRRQTGHGLAVFLISIAVGIAACSLVLNDAEEDVDEAIREFDREAEQIDQEFREYDRCLREHGYRLGPCRHLEP